MGDIEKTDTVGLDDCILFAWKNKWSLLFGLILGVVVSAVWLVVGKVYPIEYHSVAYIKANTSTEVLDGDNLIKTTLNSILHDSAYSQKLRTDLLGDTYYFGSLFRVEVYHAAVSDSYKIKVITEDRLGDNFLESLVGILNIGLENRRTLVNQKGFPANQNRQSIDLRAQYWKIYHDLSKEAGKGEKSDIESIGLGDAAFVRFMENKITELLQWSKINGKLSPNQQQLFSERFRAIKINSANFMEAQSINCLADTIVNCINNFESPSHLASGTLLNSKLVPVKQWRVFI